MRNRLTTHRNRPTGISGRLRAVRVHLQLGLLYTSCNGKTYKVAEAIKGQLGATICSDPINLQNWTQSSTSGRGLLQRFSGYIVGAPTYNTDAHCQRTGTYWDDWLYNGALQQLQLEGKPFAVFGCGDSVRFKNNFADAIGELHDVFTAAGGISLIFSYTSPSTYLMKTSKSIRNTQHPTNVWGHSSRGNSTGSYFVGLPLDFHNQPELTDNRISSWCSSLLDQLEQQYPATLGPLTHADSTGHQQQQQQQQQHEVQQQQLEVGDWAAAWPCQGEFQGEYPRGFRFTDRWYSLGDRWYRFADVGFQVRAGFREHAVYTYAYTDIISVQVQQQHPLGAATCSQHAVDVWVTVKDRSSGDSGCVSGTGSTKHRVLVFKEVECWAADGSNNTIAAFLTYQMRHCKQPLVSDS